MAETTDRWRKGVARENPWQCASEHATDVDMDMCDENDDNLYEMHLLLNKSSHRGSRV